MAQQTTHRLFVFVQYTEESGPEEGRMGKEGWNMEGMRGLWREFANAAAAASHFRKSSCRGFRLVSWRDVEFHSRPKRIFHLARIIYTHALATSQNSPRMFHAEINVPRLHLSENETACPEDFAECYVMKPFQGSKIDVIYFHEIYSWPRNIQMRYFFVCGLKLSRFRVLSSKIQDENYFTSDYE